MFLPSLVVALCFTAGVFSQAPKDLLMIDILASPQEQGQATLAGFTFDLVSTAKFNSMTTEEFSVYKAILIGDPGCTGQFSNLAFLETNKTAWSSAITGNIVLLGNDASYAVSANRPAAPEMANSHLFAAGQAGATGLYFSDSCYGYYTHSDNPIPLTAFSYFGTFTLVRSVSTNAHFVASSPVRGTLTDADIQNSEPIMDIFTAYPSSGVNPFVPVAIVNGATGPGSMTFGDGSSGVPFILTRGPAVCGDQWQPALGEECDNGELNGVDGNECSIDCKCVSGLPDGNGHCLPPPPATTPTSSLSSSTTESASEASTSEASSTEDSITVSTSSDDSFPESTTSELATSKSSTPGSSITRTLPTDRLQYNHITTSTSSMVSSLPNTESSFTTEMSSPTVRYANTTSSTTSAPTFSQGPSDSSRVPPSFTRPDVSSISALDTTSTSALATSPSAGMGGQSSSTAPTSDSGIPNTPSTTSSSSIIPSLASTNPLTTPESTSSLNPSTTPTSPSSTGTLPSTSPPNPNIQITFIIQIVFPTRIKRQLVTNFAVIDAFGTVESTPICQLSSLFGVNAQGQMVSNSLTARALPAAIARGSGPFTFALLVAGQVDTTFSASGGQLLWNNTAFANGNAVFAIGPASSVIEVFYSGVPPLGYQTIAFKIIPAISVVDACAALGVPVITTTTPRAATVTTPGAVVIPTPMPSGSPYPVGYEVVVYVTINTVLVAGSTVCLTTPTYTKTNMIYRSAVPGSPCYPCLDAEKFKFPKNPKDKCTVVTSSCTGPNSALFTAPSAVYKPCQACVATTLPRPAITPGAPGIEKSPGFSPVKTVTIGGGQVIYGSMSMSGQVIPTAVAMPVPGNAPQSPGGQPAQPGVPAPYAPPNVNVNTKAPDSPPVSVNTKPADVPPVIVGTKAAEAPPSQPTPPTVNTQTPVTPPDVTQSITTVSGAAASVVGHLTFLYFILLGIVV